MEKPKAEYPNRICSFKWYPQKEMDAFLEEQAEKLRETAREISRSFGDDFEETQGAEDLAEVIAALEPNETAKAKESVREAGN
jgi:hypothetical protein